MSDYKLKWPDSGQHTVPYKIITLYDKTLFQYAIENYFSKDLKTVLLNKHFSFGDLLKLKLN